MSNGRAIGASFERQVATDLRAWLGDGWTVSRNPPDRQAGADGAGEFAIRGPAVFPFVIECKAHRSFSLRMLFRDPLPSLISGWWEQACHQAAASNLADGAGRAPLLIMRERHWPVVCMIRPGSHSPGGSAPMRVTVHAGALEEEWVDVWRWDDLTWAPVMEGL